METNNMKAPSSPIDSYHSAAPGAEECVAYQVPGFRVDGKVLVAMAAMKHHCAFYVMSPAVVEAHADDLRGFDTGKGTIRFAPDKPLPSALVRKLIKARIAEDTKAKGTE
jgi:uncharacterized protein YdhG (YjbR/CyaY superfamily)